MKILITVDPEIPVPPVFYGGIERIVDLLVRSLCSLGHEVTLFAHKNSNVPCKLVPYIGDSSINSLETLQNMFSITKEIIYSRYDIVHSFGRLAYILPLLPLSLPKIMSYQREPTLRGIKLSFKLARRNTLVFTGCSEYIAAKIRPYAPSYAICNAVPTNLFSFQAKVDPDAPLVFLGRIEYIKGTHLAIEIARKSNRKLIIAGNVPGDTRSQVYFKEQIEPSLDGKQICYIGPVNDQQKNDLLGNASAFLMPILWDEPFGIVMAEALACGTPVLALNRGAVPEVVKHGLNGFVGNSIQELIEAVLKVETISREECRKSAEQFFSSEVIVGQYIQLYEKMISHVQINKNNS